MQIRLTCLAILLLACTFAHAGELTPAITVADIDVAQCAGFDGARATSPGKAEVISYLLGLGARPALDPNWEVGPVAGKDRYFRLAFTRPLIIGTIYTTFSNSALSDERERGLGESISFLKPDAPYPGDVTRDEQWTSLPAGSLKTLPAEVRTRALRFSDRYAQPQTFSSRLGFSLLLQERYYNALSLGQSKKTGTIPGKPESWLGSWTTPQQVVAILANSLNTPVQVEVLKPDTVEPTLFAPPERWKHLPGWTPAGLFPLYRVNVEFATRGLRLNVPSRGLGSSFDVLLPLVNLGDAPAPPSLQVPPPPYRLNYKMPMDGFIALEIDDKTTGKRVRRLVAETPRDKGTVSEPWDLKDDDGQYVPPGDYTWKALARPPFKLTYEITVNNAGQPAWWAPPPGKGGGGWMADHSAPLSTCAVGDLVFLGSPVAESGQSLIAVDQDGNKLWGEGILQLGFMGPERIATDGRCAYLVKDSFVQQVDPQKNFASRTIFDQRLPRDLPGNPISGTAGRGDKLYIAYNAPAVSWLTPSFTSEALDPGKSMPRIWLRNGHGHRGGRGDKSYEEGEYDELMKFYAAFLTENMPDTDCPSLPGAGIPSSTQAYFGDAPAKGPLGGMVTAMFKQPVPIGSVLVPEGNIKVYALKPGVKLTDDQPAEEGPGGDDDEEVGNAKFNEANWIPLPISSGKAGQPAVALAPDGGVLTAALRFKTTRLIYALAMGRRFIDLAPQAERYCEEGTITPHGGWRVERSPSTPITKYNPALMELVWDKPVTLRGVSLTSPPSASYIYVDYWIGPADADPRAKLKDDTCWKEAGSIKPVSFGGYYGQASTVRSVDFGALVATRAVRVRAPEPEGHRGLPMLGDASYAVTGAHRNGFEAIVAYQYQGGDPALPAQLNQRITEFRIPPPEDKTGQLTIIRHIPLPAPGNIAFNAQGTLYAFSSGQLVTVPLEGNGEPKVVVTRDKFSIPGDLTVDKDGVIYATDLGSKNIKVFDPKTGALLRTIGTAGGQQLGKWDPQRLDRPTGITVDAAGKLWVADNTFQPKRIQRWNRDGAVEKWFLGPTPYGGGGWLDSGDKNVLNFNGMKFTIDWQQRTWKLDSILFRPGEKLSTYGAMPDRPVYLNGRRYLVGPAINNAAGIATICDEHAGIARPMAVAGKLSDWGDINIRPDLREKFGKLQREQYFFVWCDKNGDGIPQADEVQLCETALTSPFVGEDLSLNFNGCRLRTTGFTPQGVPMYDLAKLESTPALPTEENGTRWVTADGRTFKLGLPADTLFAADGKTPLWQYPNNFNHHDGYYTSNFGYNRPPGVLNQEHFPIGHFTLGAEEYFVTNSDAGDWFCYTGDGLLAGCLLGGPAGYGLRQWTMPEWIPGKTDLSDLRPGQEHYQGCVVKANDGKVYLVAGHNHVSVVRVDGLEQAQRLGGAGTVTPADIAAAQAWEVEKAAKDRLQQEPKVAEVPFILNDIDVNDGMDKWPDELFFNIHDYWQHSLISNDFIVHSQAALAYNSDKLYIVAWSLADTPLRNAAQDPASLFKYGDALDITLGMDAKADPKRTGAVAGDLRILISKVNGKPVAMLYRPVAPGSPANKHAHFKSPVGEIFFDLVEPIEDAEIAFKTGNSHAKPTWIIAAAIPWKALGYPAPEPGTRLRGDVGLLQADQNGVRTVNRLYWSGKSQTVIADIPSEARLTPAVWGEFYFCEEPKGLRFGGEE